MNLAQFFEHWRITENPFRGEEARTDSVFARIGLAAVDARASSTVVSMPRHAQPEPQRDGRAVDPGRAPAARDQPSRDQAPREQPPVALPPSSATPNGTLAAAAPFHSEFEKIVGDLARPSTAIVFGEKGSGKTAIRLQIADRVAAHNRASPAAKVLLAAYDDLNGVLERLHRRVAGKTPLDSFQSMRLADHIDALLGQVVPRLVDTLLHKPSDPAAAPLASDALDLGHEPRKLARRLGPEARRDLLLLQAVYDRPDAADLRTARLRSTLRVGLPRQRLLWSALAYAGWIPAAAVLVWTLFQPGASLAWGLPAYAFLALLGLYLIVLAKHLGWDRLAMLALARRLRRQIRTQARFDGSYARSLRQLDPAVLDGAHLPIDDGPVADEARYAMLERLRRALRPFGYSGILVVVDRVDEPTLVSGDAERMKAVVWPMLNNKFLQAEGLGVKMLLPIELRHALFKESSAFFQEARLDKQNLVERLSWTGAMLYDLCDARLKACRAPGAPPISLMDLFDDDVQVKDVVDALDQMHQPRDAFKFLYACLTEHCSNVTAEQGQFTIPRLVLETVRKQQSDRVQQLYRGIRPA